ncbi:sugar transferase [Desulfococcaceae bacterium HSG9]|nr:sugar transferase [Desulfococcaceae bacterium HSG9]
MTIKRIFDIIGATIGIILAAPVMGVVAVLLLIESYGPVIFSQERLGQHGKRFRIYKFRKFPVSWGDDGQGVTARYDIRMTRVGAFLERTKLDELPQLWNILKGEMTIAGPRPESMRFKKLFAGEYIALLKYKPGLFGPSQVAFRNEAHLYPADEDPEVFYRCVLFPQKAQQDLAYFQKADFLSDLIWIIKGVWFSLSGIVNWRQFLGWHLRIVLTDILMIEIAWLLSHFLRFSVLPELPAFTYFYMGQLLIPAIIITVMFIGGCYQNPVRFFAISDAMRLTVVISIGWFTCFCVLIYLQRDLSFALLVLNWFIILPFLVSHRIWHRLHFEKRDNSGHANIQRILIYGVGVGGAALSGWMIKKSVGLNLVGFLDDNPLLKRKKINGHRVLGYESDIPTIHKMFRVNEIWTTFRLHPLKKARLEKQCDKLQIKLISLSDIEPFARIIGHPSATVRNEG